MIKINHILPVVCLFLFVQCANQARLSDDIEALKKQVTDNGKRSRALEAEATALKQILTDNYVDTIEFDRRIRLLPPEGMTEQEQEDFGVLKKTMCSALEFVEYFKEVFKSEIGKKSKTDTMGTVKKLRTAIADCKAALEEFNPPNSTNSSSVPTTITTPIRTNNTSPRSEGEATASIRSSPE